MYVLMDTFNNKIISRHRKIEAAAKALKKFNRCFINGSYIPSKLMLEDGDDYKNVKDSEAQYFWRLMN